MKKSGAHPRIRSRRKAIATEKLRELAQDRQRCVVALETAVKSLSELRFETRCDHVKTLIEYYEWAIEELQTTVDGPRVDDAQVISIARPPKRLH